MSKDKANIVNLFLNAAKAYPDNLAIIQDDKQISYAQLADEVKRTATYFAGKGIKPGDRVLVFVPMSIDLYRIVLSLFYLGAAAVFLDEWVSKERLLLCCKIAQCKGFIGTPKARFLSFFAKELRQIPVKLNWRKMGRAVSEVHLIDSEATALITFTTGSTGTPKAADRSHNFLAAQFDILNKKIQANPEDVDMSIIPIVLFVNLGVGCTSVIANFNSRKPESLEPKLLLDQINRHKVNRLTGSPFVVKSLATHMIRSGKEARTLKSIFTGGAPVFPSEAALYTNAFKQASVNIIYGSTEAEPISSIDAEYLVKRKDELTIGLPVGITHPKTAIKLIKIVDHKLEKLSSEELSKLEVREGEIGEVIVAGDHVLKRYYNNTEAFAANKIVVEDAVWHRTGDSAKLINKELFLTGRCKQLIPQDGSYISPFIVENIIQDIEGVSMGTIVRHRGKLKIVLETKLGKEILEEKLKELDYEEVVILKTIPRDPRHFSKIDYPKLNDLI